MARFIGTPQEFYQLFGTSLLTNAVHAYTKEYVKMVGICQDKGKNGIKCTPKSLEAAHNHENGFSRKSITLEILSRGKYRTKDGMVDVDIDEFLKDFYEAHRPFHKTIRVLCKKHHGAYDKGKHEKSNNLNDTIYGMPKEKLQTEGKYTIDYYPSPEAIIDNLNECDKCYIHYHLAGGDVVTKIWNNVKAKITKANLESNVVSKSFLKDYRNRIERITVSISNSPNVV